MKKYTTIPRISGNQLIKLLVSDGWQDCKNSTHGRTLKKLINGKWIVTTVQVTKTEFPEGTLGSILGVRQTGIGKQGLLDLLNKYGL
jgi:predicted RNA binding protein YcfA (HicA-like mRNA interferase family)